MIKIEEKKYCCGCMACVQKCPKQCITMSEDEEGFLYPQVDKTNCVDCGLCEKVCPVTNPTETKEPKRIYAAINTDEKILRQSSSGGIFSLLAEKVLLEGGVVFGAGFNEKWEVCHSYVETIDGLDRFRGSKYVQSRIGDSYKQAEAFLKKGLTVLFSGTPCQIAGLKHYLKNSYENLICVDIICHGSPSPGIWKDYLKQIPAKLVGGKNTVSSSLKTLPVLTGISFRDKTEGWQKYGFSVNGTVDQRETENSVSPSNYLQIYENHRVNLYMRGFLNNLYLRPSCHHCPARHGKSDSDILLGDFWGIVRRHPEFYNKDGLSLVLSYTKKGDAIFNSLPCKKIDATYEDALDCNINIEKDEPSPKIRAKFFKAYSKYGIKVIEKYCLQEEISKLSFFKKIKFRIKSYLKR